jgi:hypothetical protein
MTVDELGPDLPIHVAHATRMCCMPLFWHDRSLPWPKTVTGGSCFVLQFAEHLVLVTAAHVLRAYQDAARHTPTLVCQLRLLPFDLSERVIQVDDDLDIATFALSQEELARIRGVAVDCRVQGPPLECGRGLSLAGFPELMREVYSDGSAEFGVYSGLPAIDAFSDRDILTTYDPTRDQPLLPGVPAPPLGFNLSGCSGGIVLMPDISAGELRLFAVGLIVQGPQGLLPDEDRTSDTLRIRRIHCIQPDGSIQHVLADGTLDPPSVGWLPR